MKNPEKSKQLEGKKKQTWRNLTPSLWPILQSYSNQDSMVLAQK